MIKAYFQSEIGSHSELVATFQSDEMYQHFIPMLEHVASRQNCILTESDVALDIDEAVAEEGQAVGYSCLSWSIHDFYGDYKAMDEFFRTHNEVIIQHINELINLSKEN